MTNVIAWIGFLLIVLIIGLYAPWFFTILLVIGLTHFALFMIKTYKERNKYKEPYL